MATRVKLLHTAISPTLAGASFTGDVNFEGGQVQYDASSNSLDLQDSIYLQLGTDNDLRIYHDGSHARLRETTGDFRIQTTSSGVNALVAKQNAEVEIYHAGAKKIETSSTGATVTGTLTVTGDLDITGNVNSASVTDLDVTDKTITLGVGQTEAQSSLSDGLLIALNAVPSHRDVRVHDCHILDLKCDFGAIGSGVKNVWGDIKSGISWGDAFANASFIVGAEKFHLSADQAKHLLDYLKVHLGEKIARSAFKKILKRVLKLSEDTEKLAEEDTAGLREFAGKVRNAYAEDGFDGVAEGVAENPELTAEALGEAAEIAAE